METLIHYILTLNILTKQKNPSAETIKYSISSSQYEVLERVAPLMGKQSNQYCPEALINMLGSELDSCFRRCDNVDLLYEKLGRNNQAW